MLYRPTVATRDSPASAHRPRTSTRDLRSLEANLRPWLARRLRSRSFPVLTFHGGPAQAGFSSETLLFDADWAQAGRPRHEEFVLRLPPPPDAFPLFPRYELERQARVMRLLAKKSTAPVPEVRWVETDPSVLGDPFFVMERVNGDPAPDLP